MNSLQELINKQPIKTVKRQSQIEFSIKWTKKTNPTKQIKS